MKGELVVSRKKSKQKQMAELIQGAVGLLLIGAFLITYNATKSLAASVIAAGVAFVLVIGTIIVVKMSRLEKLKRSGIHEIDKMDGRQFENYLGQLFKAQGYKVIVTQATGDYGADLVIDKDGKKIVVQAKRYSKNVGIKAVQEAYAAIGHYNASEAWVVTNSDYTEAACTLAKSNSVKLIQREQLIEMILKMKHGESVQTAKQQEEMSSMSSTTEAKVCKRCGKQMIRRKGPRGDFYGCSTFPKCRNTETVGIIPE